MVRARQDVNAAARWHSAVGWSQVAGVILWLSAVHLEAVHFPLRWRWSNPQPHGNNIIGLAYSPSLSLGIQVAERGQIYSSDDLSYWIPRESGVTNALRAVTFFGNRIVITGENGLVLYADAVDQFQAGTLLTGPTTDWLEGVAASTNLLVAVGDQGAIYTSSDGARWRRQTTAFTDWLTDVAWGNGRFVAVGEAGVVLFSTNGTNWTRRVISTADWLSVHYASLLFTSVGGVGAIASSLDGNLWFPETSGSTNALYTLAASDVNRMAAGENEVLWHNGLSWLPQLGQPNSPPDWTYLSSLGRPDFFFLLAGRTGMLVEAYRTNLASWLYLQPYESLRPWLFDVAFTTNLYVAVGDRGSLLTSGDGVVWTLELVPASVTNAVLLGAGGTTNLWVVVGSGGNVIISPNTLVTNISAGGAGDASTLATNVSSTWGVMWNAVPRFTTNDLQGVAARDSVFVVTGDRGSIFSSTNGTNWTLRTTPTNVMLSCVVAWPGGFVATGDLGVIMTSSNGLTWTRRGSGTSQWLYKVRYLGGPLVAVGQNGTILTSTNGAQWTPRTSGTTQWLHDVTRIEDTYFAVGKSGTVLSSSNLVTWTSRGTITQKSLYGAATDGAQLIVLGLEGCILRSQVVPDLTPVDFVEFEHFPSTNAPTMQNLFLFGGRPDQRFVLERCRTLDDAQWTNSIPLEILDSSGTLYYLETEPLTNTLPRAHYRTRLTP
jgi:hypothetical protein